MENYSGCDSYACLATMVLPVCHSHTDTGTVPIQPFTFDSFTLAIFGLPDRIAAHGTVNLLIVELGRH